MRTTATATLPYFFSHTEFCWGGGGRSSIFVSGHRSGLQSVSSADGTFVVNGNNNNNNATAAAVAAEDDNSLGILSPTDMRSGLPSLSTSVTSSSAIWSDKGCAAGGNGGDDDDNANNDEPDTITEEPSTSGNSSYYKVEARNVNKP